MHLAQLNIAHMRAPKDSPELASFVAGLDPLNRLAEAGLNSSPQGFARVVLSPSARSVSFYARGGFAPATSLMVREPLAGS